ncbi:MAG: hypothetical protein ACRD12_01360, partial [Acidimicrobiales bacterium]
MRDRFMTLAMAFRPRTPGGVAAVLALVVVTATAAVSGVAATQAGADPVAEKRAEAASLAAKLNDQARRIVALDVEYRRAERQLNEAEGAVTQAETELAAATRRQDELKRLLVVTAQSAYVGGGSMSVLRYLVDANHADPVARRAYLHLVTGQDRQVIGQLRATREDLESRRHRLDDVRRRAGAEAEAIGSDRRALDQAIRVQRSNLAAVNDDLAGLVAAEQ